MHLFLLALVAARAACTAAVPTPSEKFMNSLQLDENGDYTVYWKFDNKTITFETHVKTTGWVGLGISPNGGMTGSDIVIGWVANDGKAYLKDRYATDFKMPIVDPHQDWFLRSGREEAGFTILKFYRDLDTKDCTFDRVITEDTIRLIWAFRAQDPSHHDDIAYHGATNRGSKSINLLELSPIRESPELARALTTTVTQDAVLLPNTEQTTYYCHVMRPPNVTTKHHIIKFSPLIQKQNIGSVHHLILQGCYHPNPEQFIGRTYPCYEEMMPRELMQCRFPIALWAVGGGDFYFPDEVGFSIGGPGDPTLFILETHFDNPELKSGIVDSSGLTLWYTPEIRQYDAGMVMTGNDGLPQLAIPPRTPRFTVFSICHSSCTSQKLPAEGIKVFATVLHTHLAGRTVHVHHFRGDKEIGDIGQDNQYDFNYQQIRAFIPPRIVKPGDTLVARCSYNTATRQEATFGGLGTKDEMCLGWMLYYPKVDLDGCASYPIPYDQLRAVNYPNVDSLLQNGVVSGDVFMSAIQNTTWSPSAIEALQKAQMQSALRYGCWSIRNVSSMEQPFPSNLKFQPDPEPDCFPVISSANVHLSGQAVFWLSTLFSMAALVTDRHASPSS